MSKRKNCKYSRNWQIELFALAQDFCLNMNQACEVIDSVSNNPAYAGKNAEFLYDRAYSGIKDLIGRKLA